MDRRGFLKTTAVALAGYTTLGSSIWRALASHSSPVPGPGPYGALGAPDANGLRLPAGFSSRIIARSNQTVPGTNYRWHFAPDGGATFPTADGGWIYVCNSEVTANGGGAGALRFDANGTVTGGSKILERTSFNCSGGATPWGTWLSCEEIENGQVWECDPTGTYPAIPRRQMGTFAHEAAAVDPLPPHRVYLTEDSGNGRFYRFTPDAPLPLPALPWPNPILHTGLLEVAMVAPDGAVSWTAVPQPNPVVIAGDEQTTPTREQVPGSTRFNGGEGAWFDQVARTVYFTTKGDNSIWAYDVDAQTMDLLFTSTGNPASPLNGIDAIMQSPGGELFICEDHGTSGGPLQMVLVDLEGGSVSVVAELTGQAHDGSELTGPAFSPDGTRLYFSSQRGFGPGATFEIMGPFRSAR